MKTAPFTYRLDLTEHTKDNWAGKWKKNSQIITNDIFCSSGCYLLRGRGWGKHNIEVINRHDIVRKETIKIGNILIW